MKKNIFIAILSFVALCCFQACDDNKTYAEMLEEESDAVDLFIKDKGIKVITKSEFDVDTITNLSNNEYAKFSNGVYLQIKNRGDEKTAFKSNDEICVRYVEVDIASRDTITFNVPLEGHEDNSPSYMNPGTFRYVLEGDNAFASFLELPYLWAQVYSSKSVPSGWLMALPYLRNNAQVNLIVSSKMGHSYAQQYVKAFYYELSLSKAKN